MKKLVVTTAGLVCLSMSAFAVEAKNGEVKIEPSYEVMQNVEDFSIDEVEGSDVAKVARFALTCIGDSGALPNGFAINYEIRIGNGPWVGARHIVGGGFSFINWQYANPGNAVSPDFAIRFDSDLDAFGTNLVNYNLEKFASPEPDCRAFGKHYVWNIDGVSGRYIDLVNR